MEKQNNHIDRRGFLKIVGISAATTTAALYGCGSGTKSSQGRNASSPVPTDQMTYRSVGDVAQGRTGRRGLRALQNDLCRGEFHHASTSCARNFVPTGLPSIRS